MCARFTLQAEPAAVDAAAMADTVADAVTDGPAGDAGVIRQTFVLGKDPAFTFEVSPPLG